MAHIESLLSFRSDSSMLLLRPTRPISRQCLVTSSAPALFASAISLSREVRVECCRLRDSALCSLHQDTIEADHACGSRCEEVGCSERKRKTWHKGWEIKIFLLLYFFLIMSIGKCCSYLLSSSSWRNNLSSRVRASAANNTRAQLLAPDVILVDTRVTHREESSQNQRGR